MLEVAFWGDITVQGKLVQIRDTLYQAVFTITVYAFVFTALRCIFAELISNCSNLVEPWSPLQKRNAMRKTHASTVSVNPFLHFHETNNTKSLIYLHLSLLFCFSCNCGVCFNVHYSYALAVDKRLLLLLLLLLLSFHDHYNKNMFL